eukprot:CAMPEP_0179105666 /NCGR_PEP_ID=MMETSP0796-20121207/49086_1 /TAXON_ID=73915 /ORGANISM="Pyrodinium bahamense, Strain pbaha01" /LENGTH=57 /DNA_ID=CAMNT_0020803661 /DNA_START=463 /DNA_END=636 /DNA_ORIENTATION=-
MYTQNSHTKTREMSARGNKASCQLKPPEIDLNSVSMDASRPPQKTSNAGSHPSVSAM